MSSKTRLDVMLVERGFVESRQKAQAVIMSGNVFVAGQRVDKLFGLIHKVYDANHQRVTTGRLNEVLADAVARQQPPTDKGKRLKVLYMTQVSVAPPTFAVFVNDAKLFHFTYQRYLENRIRDAFGFEGTSLRFVVRERGD